MVQNHKYWFICYIDPRTSKAVIYKTAHTLQYQADAEARNLLGAKNIPFVVVGTDSLNNDAIQHVKAEALKLTGDLNFVGRSTHSVPANPSDIINNQNNTA